MSTTVNAGDIRPGMIIISELGSFRVDEIRSIPFYHHPKPRPHILVTGRILDGPHEDVETSDSFYPEDPVTLA